MNCSKFGRAFNLLCKIAAAFALIIIFLLPAYAQTTGSITVIVTDQNGAVIKDVTITVTNQDTNQSSHATTNTDGVAVITGLPPGRYKVEASLTGFKKLEKPDVEVILAQTNTIPLVLGIEPFRTIATTEGLPVASATEISETRQELSSLPNFNNDLTPLLQIVPGAIALGPASLGRVVVDGKGIDQQTARLDGVDFTSLVDFPSADSTINSISSFQKPEVAGDLENAKTRSGAFGYEPRYGPGTGSVSETSTFRGLEGLHFQVYGELRNNAVNARNFFDYDGDNALRRTRFGGKVGYSFDENKLKSIFFAYDGWRGRIERNVYEALPVEATTGFASGSLAVLMRDFLPPGTLVVPNASLDPDFAIAKRRLRTTANSHALDFRLDVPFRPKEWNCPYPDTPKKCNPLTIRLTHQIAENRVPEGITGRSQLQQFAFTNGVASWKITRDTKPVRNELDLKKSTKEFAHQFRFGFNQTRAEATAELLPTANQDLAQSLITTGGAVKTQGLPLTPVPEGQQTTVPIASLGGLVSGLGRGLYLKPQSFSAIYDYSRLVTGNKMHELYAGVEARFIRFNFDRRGGLTYSFPNVMTLRDGTPGTISFVSDLSAPSPFTQGAGPRHASQEFYMGYLQFVSQFRKSINENLEPGITLTYGVRYDHFGRVRERDGRAVVVDPLTGALLPSGTSFYRVDHVNIQPRVGLSYRFSDSGFGKYTVLRAGVGLYSGVPRISDLTLPIESDRFSTGATVGVFPISAAEVVRGFVENPRTRQFQPLAFARDFSPLERSLKWDLKLTHTHNGYDFSAYYVGNIGRNLALANFTNRIVSVNTNPDPSKAAIVVREFDLVDNGLIFQPFGEFFYRRGGGSSSFNALTLQLARDTDDQTNTPKRWLKIPVANFTAKYTLSRSVGNVSGTLMSNPVDPDADFGHNSGVPEHSFFLSAAYNLWQVAENRDPDNILLGWKVTSTFRATSGLPFTPRLQRPDVVYVDGAGNIFNSAAIGRTARLNTPGGGSSGSAFMPNLVPGTNVYNDGFADRLFLNPGAFAIPAPGELGNIRRGQFRGPSFVQLDLGIRRNLFLVNKEKMLGEFQVEVFNIFNHTNFNNPATVLTSVLGTNLAENQLQPGVPFTRAGVGTFGTLNGAEPGRIIQFSLTLKFNNGFTK